MLWDIVGYLVVGPCPPFHTLQLWELGCFIFSHTHSLELRSDGNEDNAPGHSLLFGYVMGWVWFGYGFRFEFGYGFGYGFRFGFRYGFGFEFGFKYGFVCSDTFVIRC